MTRMTVALGVTVMAAVVIAVGCGAGAVGCAAGNETGTQAVDITFKTEPDPVMTGENVFEAMVVQDGKPVTDAMVSTEFFMAAMPSMNMPEMRTKAVLMHQGNGVYRGKGQVMMAGNWDVTVMAMRGGQEIGRRKITVTAK